MFVCLFVVVVVVVVVVVELITNSAVSTPLWWIFKTRCKRTQSLIQNHMRQERSESARERRAALHKNE